MLIFYGTRSTACRSVETGLNCPVCGKEKCMAVVPFQTYAHVFWIPMFPLYRKYAWLCTECGASKPAEALPVPREYRRMARTPKGTFSGLVILFAVVLFVLGSSYAGKKATDLYIQEPLVGDVYEVELDNNEFSLMKVAALSTDSVYFVHHEYNTDRKNGIADLLKTYPDDYFSAEEGMDAYTRENLSKLFRDGGIIKVIRPEAPAED